MKIDCVNVSTIQNLPGNLIAEQHRLRYREVIRKENDDVVRAGYLHVNEAMRKRIRSVTGITEPVLNFGKGSEESQGFAFHSHLVVAGL
jgi:hypothetical protein